MNNQPKHSHAVPLFKQNNILKFEGKIIIGNIKFVSKSINNLLPSIFKNWFIFCTEIHNYSTHPQIINYLSLRIELTLVVKTL